MTTAGKKCPWCPYDCSGVDDTPLRGHHLDWLWRQLADVGDRRGDQDLVTGTATVTAPAEAEQRAAVSGLLGGRAPRSGQTVRIDLAVLTVRLHAHDERLTPGLLAAHVTRRRLGERVRVTAQRRDAIDNLRRHLLAAFAAIPETAAHHPAPEVWSTLQRGGWAARLLAADNPEALANQTTAIIAALPSDGERLDRRRLADSITGFPHALDSGTLPGLVLAILTAGGHVPYGLAPRAAWAYVGVDCDDLTGGLLALGVHPTGWTLPTDAVVTLPPRELARSAWPAPPHAGATVFVTENPSVMTAAADRMTTGPRRPAIRLLCTVGTPSAGEIDAIGRLAGAGWQVAVRADFDQAGLQHVASLLAGVPCARPWRMSAADYLDSLADLPADNRVQLSLATLPATPWDPDLHTVMAQRGLPAYEESLIDKLLADLTTS